MKKARQNQGTQVLPGLWKLNMTTWIVRAQRVCPTSGKKINRRRILRNTTRTEAIDVLEKLRRDLRTLEPIAAQGNTLITVQTKLEEFAISWMKTKRARRDLARSTEIRYANALDRLSPWLKQRALSEITRNDIQDWMGASRKKFGARTVNGWLRVLRACLAEALADGLIAHNPATQVRPLKEDVSLEETNSLSAHEMGHLLLALKRQGEVIHAVATTQAITGMRWGEVSALMWDDLDETTQILRIRRTVSERKLQATTKTRKARIVGVPAVLMGLLLELRQHLQDTEHPGRESGLIFPSLVGTPLTSGRISDALAQARSEAGIRRRFTSHGFRRSLTDYLREAAVDPVVAAGLTGHETERMRRHYSTVRESEALQVGEKIAKLIPMGALSSENSEAVQPSKESFPPARQPSKESSAESFKESTTPKRKKAG